MHHTLYLMLLPRHIKTNLTVALCIYIHQNNLCKVQNLLTDRYKSFSQSSSTIKPISVVSGWIDGFIIVQKQGIGGNQVVIPVVYGFENYNTYSVASSKDVDGIKIGFTNNTIFVDSDRSTRTDLVIIQARLRYF